MMQPLVENHGDGKTFMNERINNFIERVITKNKQIDPNERIGSISSPASFESLPENLQSLIGNAAAEQGRLIGVRTAELHKELAKPSIKTDFKPEPFSLHYQRSLFSSIVSLIRESVQAIHQNANRLNPELKEELELISSRKGEILSSFKKIYSKKFDVVKTRIHGNYHLRKILITGKDICIHDFGGDPFRTYGERKLKRSPVKDVAFLVRSIYYAAYDSFINNHLSKDGLQSLLPFAWFWAHYISGFFLQGYFETVKGAGIIPENEQDLNVMLQSYLLERAFYALNYELINRPEHTTVPVELIKSILSFSTEETVKS
jgi:maltose alpha-D-glucosyltransferase/alpha-amylase